MMGDAEEVLSMPYAAAAYQIDSCNDSVSDRQSERAALSQERDRCGTIAHPDRVLGYH